MCKDAPQPCQHLSLVMLVIAIWTGEGILVVLTCIVLFSDIKHLFMYYWPSVYLLCKNAYWYPLLILKSDYFFDIELYEFFLDFGSWPLITYTICKHSLPFYGLPSNFFVFLCCAENFKFDVIPHFCCCLCFSLVTSPNSHYQNQCQGDYSLCFLLDLFMGSGLQVINPFWVDFCVWC